ncbi:MAG: peptidylprolyl isomerase [Candidatus Nomurabacteria bacterium]|nr:peptidylprolyl isomerase [Candidatus Nomurabacteria bacterium]
MNKTFISIGIFAILVFVGVWIWSGSKPTLSSVKKELTLKVNEQTIPDKIEKTKPIINLDTKKTMQATFNTTKGDITVELLSAGVPKTVENFTKLVKEGFYNGIKFHRVISGFMIQAGDPQTKDDYKKDMWGTGGPGYKFDDELTGKETYPQGTLAMANAGPNTNGSQFFIVTASPEAPLPPSYTVFGHVVSGIDIALEIEKVPRDSRDRPLTDIVINSITLN